MCTSFFSRESLDSALLTTDRDLESQRHEKVKAWICARPTTHHDLANVIPDKTKEKRKRNKNEEKVKAKTCTIANL